MTNHLSKFLLGLCLAGLTATASAVNFNGVITENFNSMGTSGTTPPAGWSLKVAAGGSNNSWTTTIPSSGTNSVADMIATPSPLATSSAPSSTNNNSYNAGAPGNASNRLLTTSPTGVAGVAIQLDLTNATGAPVYALEVSYLMQRFNAPAAVNDLPGHWLFYSLNNGVTWINASSLNPTVSGSTGVIVPNTVGVTTVPATIITLASSWNAGANLLLRWVDDNATQTSPDQIIGLDEVRIAASADFAGAFPGTYTQNFDSMGAAGTTPPPAWSMKLSGGGGSTTWSTAIAAAGANSVADMGSASAGLTATNAPTATNNNGYNAGAPGASANRLLTTSPTGAAGVASQLQLINISGSPITSLQIGYSIRRFTAATTANELPGYWLFYSLDNGATWSNVSALNPTLSGSSGVVVPNTIGVTTVPPTRVTLLPTWASGAGLLLRWVDDNAEATSPDQIIGLDEVSIAANPVVGLPPTITLTSPTTGGTFTAPATVALSAAANDADGTVTKVEFYHGSTKIGEAAAARFTATWNAVAAGAYSVTAVAFDNDGNATVSSPAVITVNAPPGSGTLSRGPYLQQASPTEMTIRWRSSQSVPGRVQYGTSADELNQTASESSTATDHVVRLTGLTPSTTYYYNVGSQFDVLSTGADNTFTTPPPAGTVLNTRIWVLGDAGTASSNQRAVRDAFYTYTGARTPDLVLQLGDNAYNSGLDTEFQAAMFNIYGDMLRKSPFWSCLGNHETAQSTAFVDTYPYFNIYTFPTQGECGGVPSGTEHYFSFDYGNIHFISLDSQTASRAVNGAMATWLQNDLESTTATWIIAFFHHPPYTKGSHNSDTESQLIQMRQNILPILEAGGVDLVLTGHSHCYERSFLLDGHYGLSSTLTSAMKLNPGDGRPGGGGAYIKPLTGPRDHFGAVYSVAGSAGQISGGSLNHPANFVSLNELGSLVLDVNGNRLEGTFLRNNSTIRDTFTMLKQGAADSDGDGLPDEWEIENGLSRFDSTDAAQDSDGDGLSNLEEFNAGTSPSNGSDAPRVRGVSADANGVVGIQINTVAGRQYKVEANNDFPTGEWSVVAGDVAGTGQLVTVPDPGASGNARRVYRISVLP